MRELAKGNNGNLATGQPQHLSLEVIFTVSCLQGRLDEAKAQIQQTLCKGEARVQTVLWDGTYAMTMTAEQQFFPS